MALDERAARQQFLRYLKEKQEEKEKDTKKRKADALVNPEKKDEKKEGEGKRRLMSLWLQHRCGWTR